MSKVNWQEIIGWKEEQLEDLRYTGFAYIKQGKYEIALPIFEALCVVDPENAYDAQTMGALCLQMNDPNKALKYLDRALKLEGDHGPTLLNLTKVFFMLGKKEEGLKLANIIKNEKDPAISSMAKALILAHS